MFPQFNTLKTVFRWVVILAVTLCGITSPSLAGEAGKSRPAIRPLKSVAEMGPSRMDLNAEDYFDIVGILNLVETGRIVVGNSELRIRSGVHRSGIELWNLVGVKLNKNGEVVVLEKISDEPN